MPDPPASLRDVLATIRAFVLATLPGEDPEEVTIRLRSGRRIKVPIPACVYGEPAARPPTPQQPQPPAPEPAKPCLLPGEENGFEPNDYQVEILVALEDKALRTDDLAAKTSRDRRSLFTPGGLKGLVAAGWVKHDHRGYYRPDAPPADE